MNLLPAVKLAESLQEKLAPYCLPGRCEIVGSIRRAREWVNDIDLALIPKDLEHATALRERVFERTICIADGQEILRTRLKDGTCLELFFAHNGIADLLEAKPSNWASVLVCRIGSKEHNIYIAERAKQLGLEWKTMRGLMVVDEAPGRKSGDLLKTETEEEFFATLNLECIPPALRER